MPKIGRKSKKKGNVSTGEMDLPPEEAEAPAPQRVAEAPAAKKAPASSAPAAKRAPPENVQTDLSYIDRPPAFFTKAPDSAGPVERSFEDYWMGETAKAPVMLKRFPGWSSWEPRMAMLIPTELTFRDMDNNELVQNCVKRGEVKSDLGVEVQNSKVDPNNYESSDYGFKITATNFLGGDDVVFLMKFESAAKQTQDAWKSAFKKNGWEAFQ